MLALSFFKKLKNLKLHKRNTCDHNDSSRKNEDLVKRALKRYWLIAGFTDHVTWHRMGFLMWENKPANCKQEAAFTTAR